MGVVYAVDFVVIAETKDDLIKRLNEWKDIIEISMGVNMNKTMWRMAEGNAEGCSSSSSSYQNSY